VLTCGADKTAKLWDIASGAVEKTFTFGSDVEDMQQCALWHKDHMVTVSLNGNINFLDMENPSKPKRVITGHVGNLTAMCADKAKGIIYTGDANGAVCKWVDGIATLLSGKGHGKGITDIAVSHDGSKVISTGMDDKLRINDAVAATFSDEPIVLGGFPSCVDAGNKNDIYAVGLSKNVVMVGGKSTVVPEKPTSLAFSDDDSKLAVGFAKGGVKIYEVNGGDLKLSYELKELQKEVSTVKWCGEFLIASGSDKQVLVYEGSAQKNPTDWAFHDSVVKGHDVSPSGKRVVSVGNDLKIIVWTDTEKWGPARITNNMSHSEGITSVQFLDEDTVVTMGMDRCLKMWKIE
jgi:WD40 repeat protein